MKKYDCSDRDTTTNEIIGICYEIHNTLGSGFVERIYLNALRIYLAKTNLKFETEKEYEVEFDGRKVGKFRVDFLIENKVILEVKAVEGKMPKIFELQVISYLKAANLNVGLLVNFGNRRCEVRRLMLSLSSLKSSL